MGLERRTGAAKMIVPSKKKKEIYEEGRIVVCLGGLGLMAVIAGEPEPLYMNRIHGSPGTTVTYSQVVLRLVHDSLTRRRCQPCCQFQTVPVRQASKFLSLVTTSRFCFSRIDYSKSRCISSR